MFHASIITFPSALREQKRGFWKKFGPYALLTKFCFSDKHKYMTYTELSKNFDVGELAIYRTYGLCTVEGMEEMNGLEYLRLHSNEDDSAVLVPLTNAEELGLRHLSSKDTVEKALTILSDSSLPVREDWKQRLNENKSLMKTGTLDSVAKVVNCLYRRSKVKALPAMEKKIYESALSLLLEEACIVLGKDNREMRKIVFSRLENV